jgi:hypothetical protein
MDSFMAVSMRHLIAVQEHESSQDSFADVHRISSVWDKGDRRSATPGETSLGTGAVAGCGSEVRPSAQAMMRRARSSPVGVEPDSQLATFAVDQFHCHSRRALQGGRQTGGVLAGTASGRELPDHYLFHGSSFYWS